MDFSTRVSLLIEDQTKITGLYDDRESRFGQHRRQKLSFASAMLRLVSMFDIKVEYADKIVGASFEHGPHVYETSISNFIDELYPEISENGRDILKEAHSKSIQNIIVDDKVYGRAGLLLTAASSNEELRSLRAKVSVGGFVYGGSSGVDALALGVFEGTTDQAARRYATASAPPAVMAAWASDQSEKIDRSKLLNDQKMQLAEAIVKLAGNPGDLPYCFTSKGLISFSDAEKIIRENDSVSVPLSIGYEQNFQTRSYKKLDAIYFDLSLLDCIFILREASTDLLEPDFARIVARSARREITWEAFKRESGSLEMFVKLIERVWGSRPRVFIEGSPIFVKRVYSPPAPQWVLVLKRSP